MFNVKHQPETIEGIKVINEISILGIEIDDKGNYFKKNTETKYTRLSKVIASLTKCIYGEEFLQMINWENLLGKLIGKTYFENLLE